MTKIKKLDKKDQPKSTKRKGKVIAKPKSDRHKKFHCLATSCEHMRHIPFKWSNHKLMNCHDGSETNREECKTPCRLCKPEKGK